MFISPKRFQHFAAMILIGDGVMAVIHPGKAAEAWNKGPEVWRGLMRYLAERPALTRAVGATQIAAGVMWALRQAPADERAAAGRSSSRELAQWP